MARTIRQTALIRGATPHDVYETLMDGKRHGALSGQKAKMSRRVGGAWNVGHDLEGRQLALVKDRKITQTWRANNWPKGVFGVPSVFYREISTGWRTYYWAPLRKGFATAR